jgi:hypothetical protein
MADIEKIIMRIKQYAGVKNDKDLAALLGLSSSNFTRRKQRGSLMPVIIEWGIDQGLDLDWLLKGENAKELSFVAKSATIGYDAISKGRPLPGKTYGLIPVAKAEISAGSGLLVLSEGAKDYYSFETSWLNKISTDKKKLILMFVKGDSMAPTIQNGDMVMIDRGRRRIIDGCIYALRVQDAIHLKKLSPRPNRVTQVISDNKAEYPAYAVGQDDLHVIGQVIWFCRQLIRE